MLLGPGGENPDDVIHALQQELCHKPRERPALSQVMDMTWPGCKESIGSQDLTEVRAGKPVGFRNGESGTATLAIICELLSLYLTHLRVRSKRAFSSPGENQVISPAGKMSTMGEATLCFFTEFASAPFQFAIMLDPS